MTSPVIDVESIRIQEGGDLPKGLYFYALVKVDLHNNESYPHVIQVYARHSGNIISLSWKSDPLVCEYRLYRGRSMDKYDGYFTIFDAGVEELYFDDNGNWVLQNTCNL